MNVHGLLKAVLTQTKGFPVKQVYGGIGHILMFHSVVPSDSRLRISNNFLEVTPEHLEKVILFFQKKGYQIISLDQLQRKLLAGKPVGKFVVFTFDDGYLDNLTYAYPVFRKYQVPFAIYITTNFPDRKTIIWWYPLEDILRQKATIAFSFKGTNYQLKCQAPEEKQLAFIQIRALIQGCDEKEVGLLLKAIFDPFQIDLGKRTQAMVLNWDQIKTLSQDPLVTIGGHTVNHYRLGALSEEEAKKEILDSMQIIEAHTGKKVEHFSFPFGTRNDVGEREFALAKACGLKTATTTRSANIFPGHRHHLHALPRINIDMATGEQELENLVNGLAHLAANRGKRIITE